MSAPYQEPEYLPWDGKRVPITFVGGYLGAGKTTAINQLLATTDRPLAVIVNDVGAVNVDASLVRRRHGDTIELTNGCICCSSIEGMGAAMDAIRARPQPPEHVVVELSGVAQPERMLPWGSSAGFVLDGLVVVVAADQVTDPGCPGWVREVLDLQIAAADLLVLTKTDAVDAETAAAARRSLSTLAADTPVLESTADHVAGGAVGRFLGLGGRRPGGVTSLPGPSLFDAHDARLIDAPAAATAEEIRSWIGTVRTGLLVEGRQLVRAKGIVETTDDGLVLLQVVGPRIETEPLPAPEVEDPRGVVVITLPA